jgi:DNA-binding transcriptional LysR family regulator
LTVDHGEAIRDAAIAGMGLTLLPTFLVADALQAGKLLPVLQDTPVVSDGIFVVYPPDRYLSTKVRALIEHFDGSVQGNASVGSLKEQCPGALCRHGPIKTE